MIISASKSIKGVGKEISEDSYHVDSENGIFIVADGMYGDGLGKTASQTAVQVIAPLLQTVTYESSLVGSYYEDAFILERIKEAFEKANEKVLELKALGTTVVLAYVLRDKVFVAHAGDSRAYLVREDNIEQLTEDHSLVASSIKLGVITPEEARKSRHKDILTRALGRMNHHPNIKAIKWQEGDAFLLTTDGLTEVLNNNEIKDTIVSCNTMQVVCDRLAEAAKSKEAEDDITMIVFRMG